jgi:hypothetical protein
VERRVGEYTNHKDVLKSIGRERAFQNRVLLMKQELNTMSMKPQLSGSVDKMKRWLAIRRRIIYVDRKAGELGVGKRRLRKGLYCWLQCVRRYVVQSLISLEVR